MQLHTVCTGKLDFSLTLSCHFHTWTGMKPLILAHTGTFTEMFIDMHRHTPVTHFTGTNCVYKKCFVWVFAVQQTSSLNVCISSSLAWRTVE